MQHDPTLFQYCPKFVLFSEDKQSVLLARRAGEADYDGVFGFIGGKSEVTDGGLVVALKREKDEEIGASAKVNVAWRISCYQVWFTKKSGHSMIIPHHVAVYDGGDVVLNKNEYAEYRWVPIAELSTFEPKIENVPEAVQAAQRLLPILTGGDFAEI